MRFRTNLDSLKREVKMEVKNTYFHDGMDETCMNACEGGGEIYLVVVVEW